MTPTLDMTKEFGRRLEVAGVYRPYAEASIILEKILEGKEIIGNHKEEIEKAFRLRERHMPMERIFGSATFCGLSLRVSKDVFKPYPETEDVVSYALSSLTNRDQAIRILDLGTGTGCILLALLHALPQATGVGVDICEDILRVAQENAKSLGLNKRAEFVVGNWSNEINEKFDLVISNPPRVAKAEIPLLVREMRDYDPIAALDGGDDGVDFFRRLAADFDRISTASAFCVVQVGPRYAKDAAKIFEKAGLKDITINNDFYGGPCCITVKKNSRKGIRNWILKRPF